MAERKTERLMNLIFALLVSRQYLTKDQIRESIADYRDSTPAGVRPQVRARQGGAARARHHCRDGPERQVLQRRAGLPHPPRRGRAARPRADARGGRRASAWRRRSGSTPGWRASPPRRWSSSRPSASMSIPSVLRMAEPKLSTDEPSFDGMWEAVTRRIPVSFVYAAPRPRAAGAPPAAVGHHLVARPLVCRRIRPRSRGAAHLPAVAGDRRGRDDRARPGRTKCPRAST